MKKNNKILSVICLIAMMQCSMVIFAANVPVKNTVGWSHGFYAISSSSQMSTIPMFDAVSFGWSQLQYNEITQLVELNTSATYGNDFSIPKGFEIPLDLATENGVEKYLMVFLQDAVVAEGKDGAPVMLSDKLLRDDQQVDKIVSQIVELCKGITKDGVTRSFDGVTIDFENFTKETTREPFNKFLAKLDAALQNCQKKLNVAVQPHTYFKGYDYKTIGKLADKVILMAHDYAARTLTTQEQERGVTLTPLTPINQVTQALKYIINPETGVQDKEKVVLQVAFSSIQWQTKDGKVINSKAYTPSYDKIYQRLLESKTEKFYHEIYQNPYATYVQDGIRNVIWYENERSVEAKIDMALSLGIDKISLWRIGTIPSFIPTGSQVTRLNVIGNSKIFNQQ